MKRLRQTGLTAEAGLTDEMGDEMSDGSDASTELMVTVNPWQTVMRLCYVRVWRSVERALGACHIFSSLADGGN